MGETARWAADPWPSGLGRPVLAAGRSLVPCRAASRRDGLLAAPHASALGDETNAGGLNQSEPGALPNRD